MNGAYKCVRSLYRAARKRTNRRHEVDESFLQVVSAEASKHVFELSRSTCAASDMCEEKYAGGHVRQGEESFEVTGEDGDTLLPGTCLQTGTSLGSSDGRGTDPALEDAESAGALDDEDAACARAICESHVQVRMRETPVRRPRCSSTSAITLPARFPGSRQTTRETPHEALPWCSELSAASSDGAASVVSFADDVRPKTHAIPDEALSRSLASARLLNAARQKMLAIRGAQASVESERALSGRRGSRVM
eukprot:TRINITY_DN9810_c0_g1_i2.p1 TRINITY_DN9810_c0_g1~~TRINITY_DN9810_c0_g1_i2.p1  ORF type:complete len:250 (-),score=36.89 TRINITY_DN9810_c0_g1_i2:172-921(-)